MMIFTYYYIFLGRHPLWQCRSKKIMLLSLNSLWAFAEDKLVLYVRFLQSPLCSGPYFHLRSYNSVSAMGALWQVPKSGVVQVLSLGSSFSGQLPPRASALSQKWESQLFNFYKRKKLCIETEIPEPVDLLGRSRPL